jgi:deoxycytidine triphosphate deaminase
MKHVAGSNSQSAISNIQPGDIQPNAVDLRLSKVFRISSDVFEISNENKKHRRTAVIEPDEDGWFYLEVGDYEVVMENIVFVGKQEAGWVITRSTLNRNGIFLTSGLYDSGYEGVMAGCLHVGSGPARIKKGTRIGQYLSFDAEALHGYSGSYGLNSAHDKKYT